MVTAVAACVPFVTVVGHGFVYDDYPNIVDNPWLRGTTSLSDIWSNHVAGFDPRFAANYYRPVMHSVYLATYRTAGLDAGAFHVVNLLAHVVASVLVLFTCRSLLSRCKENGRAAEWAVLSAGLVFAVHPVHVEAVAWLAGITDLTYTVFGLACILTFLTARSTVGFVVAGVWLLLALLSKEPAAVIPGILLAIDRLPESRTTAGPLRRFWPIGAAVAIYLVLRWNALGGFAVDPGRPAIGLLPWLLAAIELFSTYLRFLVFPYPLNAFHPFVPPASPFEGRVILAAVVVVAFAVMWARIRVHPLVRPALLTLVLPLLPVLWIPMLGEGVFAERYLYLPSAGLAWLAGWAVLHVLRSGSAGRVRLMAAGGCFVLIVAGVAASRRVEVWRDSISLWSDTAAKSPDSAAAREYLCFALYEARRFEDAATECRAAIGLDEGRVDARVNLGNSLAALGDLEGALRNLDEALRRSPTSVGAWTTRGLVRMAQGETGDALASYRRALEIDPNNAEAHNDLGVALAGIGRIQDARRELREAVRLAPEQQEYRRNLQWVERAQ